MGTQHALMSNLAAPGCQGDVKAAHLSLWQLLDGLDA
jgi:hypothetical protein